MRCLVLLLLPVVILSQRFTDVDDTPCTPITNPHVRVSYYPSVLNPTTATFLRCGLYWKLKEGAPVVLTCKRGIWFPPSDAMQCISNYCKAKPMEADHRLVTTGEDVYNPNYLLVGRSITFKCEKGYGLAETTALLQTSVCVRYGDEDNEFEPPLPICVPLCKRFSVEKGYVKFGRDNRTSSIECDPLHVIHGSAAPTCTFYRGEYQWTPAPGTCEKYYCSGMQQVFAQDPKLKFVSQPYGNDPDKVIAGGSVTLTCEDGYRTKGRRTNICEHKPDGTNEFKYTTWPQCVPRGDDPTNFQPILTDDQ